MGVEVELERPGVSLHLRTQSMEEEVDSVGAWLGLPGGARVRVGGVRTCEVLGKGVGSREPVYGSS